ncbi:MAG: glucokinase [Marinilabiliales bacterium]|nr:MAG: glucokinase [Marinilabiliales bacterium]
MSITNVVCGIDIGGTNTSIGIVDRDGSILDRMRVGTRQFDHAEAYFKQVADVIQLFFKSHSEYKLCGIGIGAPNGNFYTGNIEFAPNLKWQGVIKVTEIMQNFLPGIPVVLTNDANAAALGEKYYGSASGKKDFILITLGTGVGSGIVVNDQLVYGHDGFAGEIGHTIYDPEGRQCGCGRRGCLETYASASGMVRSAYEFLEKDKRDSLLRDIKKEEITAAHIGDAAAKGDELALNIFDYTAKILGIKLADAVAHTSPSTIYIFGGVANAGDILMKPLKRYFNEYLLTIFKDKIGLEFSGLPQNDAAVLGSAALVNHTL